VGEVGDALAVAKVTDGMLVVVRQDYCNRVALDNAIGQFEFVDAKILGVVFNCIDEQGGRYGKRYWKKHYDRKYSNRYYRSYASSAERTDQQAERG
jgi:Mrp family chromosome partitioning ATPase